MDGQSRRGRVFPHRMRRDIQIRQGIALPVQGSGRVGNTWRRKLELRGKLRPSEQSIFDYIVKETGLENQTRLLDPLPHDWIPSGSNLWTYLFSRLLPKDVLIY